MKENKKKKAKLRATQILCIILAALMVAGAIATLVIMLMSL